MVIHSVTTKKATKLSLKKSDSVFESAAYLLSKVVFPISNVCAWVSGGLVLLMSVVTVLDVLTRKILAKPISGAIELDGYMLALIAFLGIAYTAVTDNHVRVDILLNKISKKTSLFLSTVSSVTFMFFTAMMIWSQGWKAINDFRDNTAGQLTGIPLYPITVVICLCATLLFLVILVKYIRTQAEILKEYARPWLGMCLALLAGAGLIFSPEILKTLSPEMGPLAMGITFILFGMVLLFAGIPIAAAIGFCGIASIWYLKDFVDTGMVLQLTVYPSVSQYMFTVLPLFAGTSFLAFSARLSENLFGFCYRVLGNVRGGLAMATVGGCAGFAAISGDSMSTASAMASVALPEMKKYQYKDSLATGCVAAGGTIGILIPPSIGFIIYGMITEQSIGKLFIAGIIPGVIEAITFCIIIYVQCLINPSLGPVGPSFNFASKISAFWETWPVGLLITIVIGGLYSGFFTATEAGAVGFFVALLLGLVLRRFTWEIIYPGHGKNSGTNLHDLCHAYRRQYLQLLHRLQWGFTCLDHVCRRAGIVPLLCSDCCSCYVWYFRVYYGHWTCNFDHSPPNLPNNSWKSGVRSNLVWRYHGDNDGDGLDHSARRPERLCHCWDVQSPYGNGF